MPLGDTAPPPLTTTPATMLEGYVFWTLTAPQPLKRVEAKFHQALASVD